MRLIWKLLRRHISVAQFIGFCIADVFGMLIVLLSYQLYNDILPFFTQGDSFLKADYIVVSKSLNAMHSATSAAGSFDSDEVEEIAELPFVKSVGEFTSAAYHIDATMSIGGSDVVRSELFLESIPDHFIDIPLDNWHYSEGEETVPIILPRSYLTMYNFGFARNRSLPKISEGLVGMLDIDLYISGNGRSGHYKGKVIGFSSRLSTILVPHSFMEQSNKQYAPNAGSRPTRLIMEVDNPTDERLAKYMEDNDYDLSDNNLDAEKTSQFLRLLVMAVMTVGLVISILSFYILILCIYLLVQKNSRKLENLLLIGYSPARVALPYQWLVVSLNLIVFVIVLAALSLLRSQYMGVLEALFPNIPNGTLLHSVALGFALLLCISAIDIIIIRHRINAIRKRRK